MSDEPILVSTDLADWLRLTAVPGIGPATQRQLLAVFGLPANIFAADFNLLSPVIGDRLADKLLAHDSRETVEQALQWASLPGNHIVTLADPEYPSLLLENGDPPSLLYVKGRVEILARSAVAIVGSRHATPQGERDAEAFAAELASSGLVVVSGQALGIDAAAHRGALKVGGDTIAVIGTGADRIYPARNKELARQIAERGAVVSEFPLGSEPLAAHFPRRNRLIAGLSRGCLVVEAALDSGSLITARLASEQGREVFAIPGSIHSPQSKGCHRLLKQGAKLVECAADILEELDWLGAPPGQAELPLSTDESDDPSTAALLTALGHSPCDSDTLAQRTGLTADRLCAMLATLELEGRLAVLPGGRYQRLS
jgi:DNA processing protein